MATPSSSTTTPSPQLRFLQPNTVTNTSTLASNGIKVEDKEERERAVQKFIARAEMAKLTRALRTRLSYASYKAMNNLTHTTLHDLESQSSSSSLANQRNPMIRSPTTSYSNLTPQGASTGTPSSLTKQASRKGLMAPPPTTASATQSLFSSLLAPPPTKRVRTIHNPEDPPVPAPEKGKAPTPRKSLKSPRVGEGSHGKARSRKDIRTKAKEKGKAREVHKGHTKGAGAASTDADIDMKAAATLTSLLLARPSISGSASSPRSSISAGSDTGSTQSFSHFAQSSTRTVTAASTSMVPSAQSSFSMDSVRTSTPPPRDRMQTEEIQHLSQGSSAAVGSTTPTLQNRPIHRASTAGTPHPPSDTEAADSLLWLATSPSPARPTNIKERGNAETGSLRSLGGSTGLRGRVLFPSQDPIDGHPSPKARPLQRNGTGSFASTATLVTDSGGDVGTSSSLKSSGSRGDTQSPPDKSRQHRRAMEGDHILQVPTEPTIIPPTPTELPPPQLLPALPSPNSRSRPSSRPASSSGVSSVPLPSSLPSTDGAGVGNNNGKRPSHPSTPGLPFNFNDFINVSPLPGGASTSTAPSSSSASSRPAAPSLHATVGRRLFEEHHRVNGPPGREEGASGRRSGLGAGIDLMQS